MENEILDLQKAIEARQEEQNKPVVVTPETPPVSKTDELVENVFNAAVVTKIKTDVTVQDKMMMAAGKVVDSKVSTVVAQADAEDKAANVKNNKDACDIFCYSETTTAKSLVSTMRRYKYILDLIYIWTIGMFLIAPIMFFAYKIKAGMKSMWWAVLLGITIYLLIIAVPVIISVIAGT